MLNSSRTTSNKGVICICNKCTSHFGLKDHLLEVSNQPVKYHVKYLTHETKDMELK